MHSSNIRDDMINILGISGSLRSRSFNTALLQAAKALVPANVTLEVATLNDISLYDGDVESREGLPAAVVALKERIVAADGVILGTPEYNNGIPGVFKNAIDWASRPPDDIARVFRDRPFAIIGASPGGFGTVLAQSGWLPVLRTLNAAYWSAGRLLVSRAHLVFDENGSLKDDAIRAQLGKFLEGFAAFVASHRVRSGNES